MSLALDVTRIGCLSQVRITSRICIAHCCAFGNPRLCVLTTRQNATPRDLGSRRGVQESQVNDSNQRFEILACSVIGAIDCECWEDCPKKGEQSVVAFVFSGRCGSN